MAQVTRVNPSSVLHKSINFILFQVIWFACIIGAAYNQMALAIIFFIVFVLWQTQAKIKQKSDIHLLLLLLPIGFFGDSFLAFFDYIDYNHSYPTPVLAPYWIVMLWTVFALSLNHSLSWLFYHPRWALLFSVIGGPLSYLAAEKLGAIIINNKTVTLPLLCVYWLLVMQITMTLRSKIITLPSPTNKSQKRVCNDCQ